MLNYQVHARSILTIIIIVSQRSSDMLLMPADAQGQKRKLAQPFHGHLCVVTVTPTNTEVRLVNDPKATPIFVALERIR